MASSEIYNLILSLIVFVCLTTLFSVLIVWLIKLNLRLINAGLEDDKIKEEYVKNNEKKQSRVGKIFDMGFYAYLYNSICCALFFYVF